MKKKFKVFTFILSTSIILSACSGNSVGDKKEVKMGEMMNKGKHIFYVVSNQQDTKVDAHGRFYEIGEDQDKPMVGTKPSKDTYIDRIIETDNGKMKVYDAGLNETFDGDKDNEFIKLKDLKDKDDDEIIKMAKERDKENFKRQKKEKVDTLRADNESTDRVENFKYKKPEKRDAKISVVEDESGNHTAIERFYLTQNGMGKEPLNINHNGHMENDTEYFHKPEDLNRVFIEYDVNNVKPFKIYNKSYVGLGEKAGETMLITKVGDKTEKSKFDEPDSDYVEIDEDS